MSKQSIKAKLSQESRDLLRRNSNLYNLVYSAAEHIDSNNKAAAKAVLQIVVGSACAGAAPEARIKHLDRLIVELSAKPA